MKKLLAFLFIVFSGLAFANTPGTFQPLLLRTMVLVDRTAGTHFGNIVSGGGVAGAFDGVTNCATGAACQGSVVGTQGYAGTAWTPGKTFAQAIVYGTNDVGFSGSGGVVTVTITIYGKNGAPASGTDGTIIGSLGPFAYSTNESAGRIIISTNVASSFTNIWAYVDPGAGHSTNIAEVVFYEWL